MCSKLWWDVGHIDLSHAKPTTKLNITLENKQMYLSYNGNKSDVSSVIFCMTSSNWKSQNQTKLYSLPCDGCYFTKHHTAGCVHFTMNRHRIRQVNTLSCVVQLATKFFLHIVLCIKMYITNVCKGLESYFFKWFPINIYATKPRQDITATTSLI